MIKDFRSFITEALTLGKINGITDQHYSDRIEDRLENLKVIGLEGNDGKRVNVTPSDLSKITKFFRAALPKLANPTTGAVFKAADVPSNKVGLIRLAVTNVILPDGTRVKPIFDVYERKEGTSDVSRSGKYFWIFTIGSVAKTLKLYNVDGTNSHDRDFLINKSIAHLVNTTGTQKLIPTTVDREQLIKQHTVILNPANIPSINLDLSSQLSPADQLERFIKNNKLNSNDFGYMSFAPDRDQPIITAEPVPKQMNVTPNKTWIVEWNDKFKTWGAIPILKSKQIDGASGTEIHITVGKKWLHWLDWSKEELEKLGWSPEDLEKWIDMLSDKNIKATFNLPKDVNRIIKKGDIVSLAKENKDESFTIQVGKVTSIDTDSRSSEFPYVKTAGWDSTQYIGVLNAQDIFVEEGVRENIYILNFRNWLNS